MLSLFWGFRLTIWNVNFERISAAACILVSFRLTIWNVNSPPNLFKTSTNLCFRLTIWNVKQQEQLILPFLANVLY
ncbi:hypothetical protein [Clostridioides difficile]|uniref:hypothetical protein n=1 Tax=Clostridioides difficile TaxID=1496 RepID=UPI0013EF7FFE|nr:hypothetical protein [Clostridioides difficile]